MLVGATNHPELLDRAAWRRFQVHVDLPAPKQAEVAAIESPLTAAMLTSLTRQAQTAADYFALSTVE